MVDMLFVIILYYFCGSEIYLSLLLKKTNISKSTGFPINRGQGGSRLQYIYLLSVHLSHFVRHTVVLKGRGHAKFNQ